MTTSPTAEELEQAAAEIKALPFFESVSRATTPKFSGAPATRTELWQLIALLADKVQKLDKRLHELEARTLKYCGVWRAGESYCPDNFVTDHGGLWCARRTTTSRPGADDSWTLAVKRGGRDK
jgi:hypothetical protein